jgi:hypothetical protein
MRTILLFLSLSAFIFLIGCDQQGCNKWKQVAGELQDSDGDGWLDSNNNQRIDLIIESMDLPVQTIFGQVSLVVDDRIILDKSQASQNTVIPSNLTASSRCAGQWLVGQTQNYRARVKVFLQGETDNSSVGLLPFVNKDTTYVNTLNINGKDITFHYRTRLTRFSDPSPTDSTGDVDLDGITDAEESRLARQDNRMGDPLKRDIIVVQGFIAPKWAMTKRCIERITTVFIARGFNFLICDENSDMPGLTPGQVVIFDVNGNAIVLTENTGVARTSLTTSRPRHIPPAFNPFTHFVVMAENIISTVGTFGEATLPGRDVVIKSHLPVLGPDPFGLEYQAKTVMHELGHNFGLCHPGVSDGTCPTGPIPVAERNGSSSCMGSPADDGGFFTPGPLGVPVPNITAITNALSRPLDYSPGQWVNINPASSRNN